MFFRRVFAKGSSDESPKKPAGKKSNLKTKNGVASPRRVPRHRSHEEKQRGLSVLQLTPLWEHVVRTNSLPEEINIVEMFDEFLERLHDPEWQVRQHALRVLVDVVIVMGQKSDGYFSFLIKPLVDNLGHPAPAVRKGALDVLRVYVAQTAMPETVMLSILNYGLDSTASDGRLTIGVLLALPSLLHPTLLAAKRNFIIGSVLDALTKKMVNISYQELAVRILLRIKEMIGPREFNSYLTAGVRRDFESLCVTYNLPEAIMSKEAIVTERPSSWAVRAAMKECSRAPTPLGTPQNRRQETIRGVEISDSDEKCDADKNNNNNNNCEHMVCESPDDKVILEREIKITDDTALTMRILETQSGDESDNDADRRHEDIEELDTVLMRVLTDSEQDETRDYLSDSEMLRRTPKRVHFGGEIVKMRTPDSDAIEQNDVETLNFLTSAPPDYDNNQNLATPTPESIERTPSPALPSLDYMKQLHIGIPSNDIVLAANGEVKEINAPVEGISVEVVQLRPKTTESILSTPSLPSHSPKLTVTTIASPISSATPSPKANSSQVTTPTKGKITSQRSQSASPKKRRRSSVSMPMLSPKPSFNPSHTPSQILYNLQKSPALSPTSRSTRKNSSAYSGEEMKTPIRLSETAVQTSIDVPHSNEHISTQTSMDQSAQDNSTPVIKSWEDLGIVEKSVLRHLKSEDWRHRSHAICKIEEALKSHDNLAKIQPHLQSLLRTLLLSEKHPDAYEDKKRVITNLISRLPLENLEDRVGQIITGLCRQGGAGSNTIAKALMQRLPTATIVSKLLSDDFLESRSSKFRENALQMVLYALMTFPSTYFDITTCVAQTTKAANDRKKRVRQAALDVLAVLGQISSAKTVMDVVQNTVKNRSDCDNLFAAVRARLSRKQLPVVSQDGHVEYALRISSSVASPNYLFGADVEWIVAGSGSVSPTSMRNRWKRQSGVQVDGKFYDDTKRLTAEGTKFFGEKLTNDPDDMMGNGVKGPYEQRLNHTTGWTHKSTNDKFNQHNIMHATTSGIPIKRHTSNVEPPMYQKFQSRSYPELASEASKLPVRQFSEDKIVQYNNRHNLKTSKIPTPATRFPAVDDRNDVRQNEGYLMNPYMVDQKKVNSSVGKRFYRTQNDGFLSDSHGTPVNLSSHKELRPVTHPLLDNQVVARRHEPILKKSFAGNFHKNAYQMMDRGDMDYRFNGDKYHQIDTNVQLESSHQQQLQQLHKPQQTITENGNNVIGRYTSSTSSSQQVDSVFHASSTDNRLHHQHHIHKHQQQMAYESQTEESQEASTDVSRNTTPEGEDDDEPEPITIISLKKSESYHQLSQTQPSTPTMRSKSVMSEKIVKSEDEVDFKAMPRPASEAHGRLIRTASSSTFIVDQTLETTNVEDMPSATSKSRPTTAKLPQSPFRQILAPPSATDIDDGSTNSVSSVLEDTKSEFGSNQTLEIAENATTATPSPAAENFDDIPIDLHKSKENLADTFALQLAEMPDHVLKASSKRASKLTRTKKISPTGGNKPTNDRMKRPNDLFPKSLRRVDRPRESFANCLVQLDSPSWDVTMNGLQTFVRLIRHHPEVVDQQMHLTAIALAKHIKNLRSQVARAACQAAGEFFITHSKTIDHESEEIASILLHRTADTNKFLRNDATKALENMSDQLPASKAIHILAFRGATHPNAVVRSNASKLLARLVEQLGADKVFALNRECREKLILTGANLLMEGSLDTRNYTKNIFKTLSTHPNYAKTLLEVIPPNIYRNIEKSLKSLK